MRTIFGDFTLFQEAEGKFGMIESLTLPEINQEGEDFTGGGLIGTRTFALILGKLEMSFTSNSYERSMLKRGANAPGTQHQWKVMGSLIVPGEEEKPFKVLVTGSLQEIKRGELTPGKKTTTDFTIRDITYYQELVAGLELFEIDLLNQVLRVDGVDQMATRRRNLGR